MKNFRNLFKLAGIVLGLFGFALMSSSCSKEKDCKCTYTEDGETYELYTITTSDKCEDLEFSYDDETYENIKCKE
jgi:hypothetical protein